MPWVRLDEEFAKHPKVVAAGPLGMAMQVAALCYCNTYLTDGFVPRSVVPGLLHLEGLGMRLWGGDLFGGGDDANWKLIVDDLLESGLWEEVQGGYLIHDYHEYQPSKEEVLKEREQKKRAGQKGGLAAAKARAQARAVARATAPARQRPKRGRTTSATVGPEGPDTPSDLRVQAPAKAPAQAERQAESKPVPVPSSGYLGSSVTEVDARDDDPLLPLRQALEGVRLHVRWDKLGDERRDQVLELAAVHGVPALVKAAQAAWQPENPPAYANAWLPAWEALPRRRISAVPPWCGQCQSDDYRWVELDDGRAAHCPRCHPSTVRAVTA